MPRNGRHAAVVGVVLTWYTVADSLRLDVSFVGFLVGQAPVLVARFGPATFAVGLAVSSRVSRDADQIANWCAGGTLSKGTVVALTYIGRSYGWRCRRA